MPTLSPVKSYSKFPHSSPGYSCTMTTAKEFQKYAATKYTHTSYDQPTQLNYEYRHKLIREQNLRQTVKVICFRKTKLCTRITRQGLSHTIALDLFFSLSRFLELFSCYKLAHLLPNNYHLINIES